MKFDLMLVVILIMVATVSWKVMRGEQPLSDKDINTTVEKERYFEPQEGVVLTENSPKIEEKTNEKSEDIQDSPKQEKIKQEKPKKDILKKDVLHTRLLPAFPGAEGGGAGSQGGRGGKVYIVSNLILTILEKEVYVMDWNK